MKEETKRSTRETDSQPFGGLEIHQRLNNPNFPECLPPGTILHGEKAIYRVVKPLEYSGFGITYEVRSVIPVGKDSYKDSVPFIMREHYMPRCCTRGEGGCVVPNPGLEDTVAAFQADFTELANRLIKVTAGFVSLLNVLDAFEACNTYYYITEYLPGKRFEDIVPEHGPYTLAEVHAMMSPVFAGVRHLHANGILHNDLTPLHVGLYQTQDGQTVPVVFHLYGCRMYNIEHTRPTWSLPPSDIVDGFSAPELYGASDSITPQLDIYSLTALILYLLTGKRPPEATHLSEEEVRKLLPADVPPPFVDALVHGLRTNPSDRPTTISAFSKELRSYERYLNPVSRTIIRPNSEVRKRRWWEKLLISLLRR